MTIKGLITEYLTVNGTNGSLVIFEFLLGEVQKNIHKCILYIITLLGVFILFVVMIADFSKIFTSATIIDTPLLILLLSLTTIVIMSKVCMKVLNLLNYRHMLHSYLSDTEKVLNAYTVNDVKVIKITYILVTLVKVLSDKISIPERSVIDMTLKQDQKEIKRIFG